MISWKLTFRKKCFPEIDFPGIVKNYCLGKDWMLFSKTHCLASAKQEFKKWLMLSKTNILAAA